MVMQAHTGTGMLGVAQGKDEKLIKQSKVHKVWDPCTYLQLLATCEQLMW